MSPRNGEVSRGNCPPDKQPYTYAKDGVAQPFRCELHLFPIVTKIAPDLWVQTRPALSHWFNPATDVWTILEALLYAARERTLDVLALLGVLFATVIVAFGYILAAPGLLIVWLGKELGYRLVR